MSIVMKSTSKSILSDLLLVDFLSSICNGKVVSKPRISLFSPSKLSDDNSVHRKSKVFSSSFSCKVARYLVKCCRQSKEPLPQSVQYLQGTVRPVVELQE